MSERVEVEVDAATARWLRNCADLRGTSTGATAAAQLRELALADAGNRIDAWHAEHPSYLADAEAERIAAADA
jgi:hypothetical protein